MSHPIAELAITGPETGEDSVSADVLAHLLAGLQQLALLMAAAAERLPLQERFRPSEDLRQRFTLKVGLPHAGSYRLPCELVDTQGGLLDGAERTLSDVQAFLAGVAAGDEDEVARVLPDSRYRERALRQARALGPRSGARWKASFGILGREPAPLDERLGRQIDRWLSSPAADAQLTVTGELVRIHFDRYSLFIRHPVSGREIECSYSADIEPDLVESRRDLVHVTGRFIVDDQGLPQRVK